LAACGGSGGDAEDPSGTVVQPESARIDFPGLSVFGLAGEPADQALSPWLASFRSFRSESFPESLDLTIGTLQYQNRSVQDEIDFRLEQTVLEVCEIEDQEPNNGSTGTGGDGPPYVSGGQSVTINTPSGPLFTVNIDDELRYRSDNSLGRVPADATLSIPGDVFPTVAEYPLFEPLVPVRLTPASDALFDVNALYSWEPVNDPGSYMIIDFLEFDANGSFLGFPAFCRAIDDGEFDIPLDVLVALDDNPNQIEVRYTRRTRRIDFMDGIILYQALSVAE